MSDQVTFRKVSPLEGYGFRSIETNTFNVTLYRYYYQGIKKDNFKVYFLGKEIAETKTEESARYIINKHFNRKPYLEVDGSIDSLVCVCGNNARSSGFQMLDEGGHVIEEDDVDSDYVFTGLIMCNECSATINQNTQQLVSR